MSPSLSALHLHPVSKINIFKKLLKKKKKKERERQSVSGGRAERDGDTESEAGPRLRAVSTGPDKGLELTDREIMT